MRVEKTNETIGKWLDRTHIDEYLHTRLLEANVLVVPEEEHIRGDDRVCFPAGTEEFLNTLRASESAIYSGICVDDEDYEEIAQYADWLIVASVVVQYYVAPVIVALTASYIERRLGSPDAR